MSDESSVPAGSAVVADASERRRRRRLAAYAALWTLALALLPTLLQIEPTRGARLETLRVVGPIDGASSTGGGSVAKPHGQAVTPAADRPLPLRYGAVREAPPSALQLRAGLGPAPVLEAMDPAPGAVGAIEPASLVTAPAEPAGPTPFSLPTTSASFGGGGPSTLIVGPAPSTPSTPTNPTPPVTTGPVTPPVTPPVTTPVAPPPVTTPPVTTPPDPGNPIVITPPTPPTGTDPGTSPPPGTGDPGGPTVTIPTDPDPSSPVTPGGGLPGVPEPSVWTQLIAGFGLAGAALRRRRQLSAI